MTITTESGSKYIIDLEKKTWRQEKQGNPNTPLRTSEGTFVKISDLHVGRPLTMLGKPLVEGASFRLINTTFITNIQD